MKRLKSSIPNGGAPLGQFPVLRDIFDTETKDAIEAILTSITDGATEGVILSGCKVSGTSGNFAISSGYVYLNGKVLRYPGGSAFSATRYITEATATEESGVFADSVTKAYIDVEVSEDLASAPGSGQYITVTFANGGQTLKDLFFKEEDWTALTLLNGATDHAAAVFVGSRRVPSFYKDLSGRVWLTGVVDVGSSGIIATLPTGYRPLNNISLPISTTDTATTYPRILTDGTIDFRDASSVFLDGISFTTHN